MPETVVQLLKESADKFGSRTALLFKPAFRYQRWSFMELWEGAGRVASLLQQRGLTKGDQVFLWGPNCPQWVLVFFGCMRAGILVVPLDIRSAPDFVERVAAKTRPKLAFVSRLTPQAHQEFQIPLVYFEELEALSQEASLAQEAEVVAADVAEIMFTSGTTGDPKGVTLTHANLMANLEATNQFIPGKPTYRLLSILPLSHMFEQMGNLLHAIRCGANITYPTRIQPTLLARAMRERKITNLLLVPQGLEVLMNGIEREVRRQGKERLWNALMRVARYTPFRLRRLLFRRVHKQFGGHLEFIVCGGAALDPELGAKWELLGVKIVLVYGATEASPGITAHTLKERRLNSVGRPIPGVEVKISLDGEVLVRGPNIMRGYWEAPEQTAAVFEDGWYRTGDQGFFDQEGFLHLNGRKKDMIVLANGQNVFPEDIEVVLRKHPQVTDAAVVGLTRGSGVEVHAALLLEDHALAPEVVSWANGQLADHQQVRGFSVWPEEDFPRTHTLKVKKGLVLDALLGGGPSDAPTEAPAKEADADQRGALPRLIAEVGGVPLEEVALHKNLGMDLNLDSLKRVELLAAIEEGLGVYLDEGHVGPETTVQQLQQLVKEGSKTGVTPGFSQWGRAWWCRGLRGALQRAIVFPLLRLTNRLQVVGAENLEHLPTPVLFAANHQLFLDNGLMIKTMPSNVRRRLAIAAAAERMQNNVWMVLNPLVGNAFPFSREGNVRASLDNLGAILDEGWSVLIYPEGLLTIGGPMQPFKSGTGLLAVEGGVPVVPIRLIVHRLGSPALVTFRRRSHVEIRFGKPLTFPPNTSYLEATAALEEAVRTL